MAGGLSSYKTTSPKQEMASCKQDIWRPKTGWRRRQRQYQKCKVDRTTYPEDHTSVLDLVQIGQTGAAGEAGEVILMSEIKGPEGWRGRNRYSSKGAPLFKIPSLKNFYSRAMSYRRLLYRAKRPVWVGRRSPGGHPDYNSTKTLNTPERQKPFAGTRVSLRPFNHDH